MTHARIHPPSDACSKRNMPDYLFRSWDIKTMSVKHQNCVSKLHSYGGRPFSLIIATFKFKSISNINTLVIHSTKKAHNSINASSETQVVPLKSKSSVGCRAKTADMRIYPQFILIVMPRYFLELYLMDERSMGF